MRFCHRALARLCLSGSNPSGNAETVEEHFGKTGGVVITFCTSSRCCGLYVTITNTFMTFWENQLGFFPNRGIGAVPVADGFRHLV